MIKPKKTLDKIIPYFAPKYQDVCKLKLDSNENPYGPSSAVINAIKALTPEQISTYPCYGELIDKVAQLYNLESEKVLVTNGADEGLSLIINTFLDEDDEILCFEPTFSMPQIYAKCQGANFKSVNYYTKWVFDADKLIEAVDEKTKIIYVSSPNNPTGELASLKDVVKILENFPDTALVLDTTYINFANECPDYYGLVNKYQNLFIIKSCSKDMAIAGLRLGIILTSYQNIKELKKVISPFSVNAVALQAGIAAICDIERLDYVRKNNAAARKALYSGLVEMGFKPYKSDANFILCDFGDFSEFIFKKLEIAGIKVRKFSNELLSGHLRITVPRVQDIDCFFDALKAKDLIVFDLDGVVFDVQNSYRSAIKQTFSHFSNEELQDVEIQQAKDLGGLNCDWTLTQYLLKKHGFEVEFDDIKTYFQEIFYNPNKLGSRGLIDNESLLLSGEIFKKLSAKYDFAVFTGRPRDEALYSLKKFDILKYFSKIISQDDVAKDKQKPHPEGLNKIKSSCMYNNIYYFGDTPDDMYAGKNASVRTFGVASKVADNAESLLEAGASGVISDITNIYEFLENSGKIYAKS